MDRWNVRPSDSLSYSVKDYSVLKKQERKDHADIQSLWASSGENCHWKFPLRASLVFPWRGSMWTLISKREKKPMIITWRGLAELCKTQHRKRDSSCRSCEDQGKEGGTMWEEAHPQFGRSCWSTCLTEHLFTAVHTIVLYSIFLM